MDWSFNPCHVPVLATETLETLSGALKLLGNETGEDELFVDGTLGEGGHSERFLTQFPQLRVIGVDADREIMGVARERLTRFGGRIAFHEGWADDFFRYYPVDNAELPRPGMILLDLGVSLFHYEKGGRGFSFRLDESLDMRIDITRGTSAAGLLATLSERALARLLAENSGERFAKRIARALVNARAEAPITSSAVLAEIVSNAVPSFVRHHAIHPATKTFAALRIAVNGELERLPALLDAAFTALKPGGRFGVITFHSLEDRIVKNYFRDLARDCICPPSVPKCVCRGRRLARLITNKPIAPTEAECAQNAPSRSAKLRVVEKALC
ncbi:MAG: 16S rRNA (cytosine(1402)-N(4))-methyltransferase RsmH [Spirochaetaceae bacterium]|jgi:16S rRNA (cytosine1402-N4)-methyltransferase|nr:16S rRNA (cytosine(1402)-N(4))-methyltransferase RsmH [Spirochaetaceae bacterium]